MYVCVCVDIVICCVPVIHMEMSVVYNIPSGWYTHCSSHKYAHFRMHNKCFTMYIQMSW